MVVYISAPFGNYLRWPGAVPTLGTYTLHRRAGFWRRWWRVLRTVRFARGTVINQLGLPSPGIEALPVATEGAMVSIHGFELDEWRDLVCTAYLHGYRRIELNLSCPNVARLAIEQAAAACTDLVQYCSRMGLAVELIAKLPPLRCAEYVDRLYAVGVRSFHLCNTIPTPYGGVSGAALKPFALYAVEAARAAYGDKVRIIGGGGIRTVQDAKDFVAAGADDVAVGSVLLNPFKWRLVRQIQEALCSK